MTWTRTRVLSLVGVLCLLGQGTLLFCASSGSGTPQLPLPVLFLLLTVVLALSQSLAMGRSRPSCEPGKKSGSLHRWFWRPLLLIAIGSMFALSLVYILSNSNLSAGLPDDLAVVNSPVAEDVDHSIFEIHLPQFSDNLVAAVKTEFFGQSTTTDSLGLQAAANLNSRTRDLFFFLQRWPEIWSNSSPDASDYDLSLIMRHTGECIAWTPNAEPQSVGSKNVSDQQSQIVRQFRDLPAGLTLEIQVVKSDNSEPVFSSAIRDSVLRTRILLALTVGWVFSLIGIFYATFGKPGLLLALWMSRFLLAIVGFFQWFSSAFPGLEFPAAPTGIVSLIDPAYFATPFAFGWFASAADALLTGILLALTTWLSFGIFRVTSNNRLAIPDKQRPLAGFVLGIVCGLLLLAVRLLAGQLADNANARLIGTGVSLTYLSFWALHIVLILSAYSVLAWPVRLASFARLFNRAALGSWLFTLVMMVAGALLVTVPLAQMWWPIRGIGAIVTVGLWILATILRSNSELKQRTVWPLLLLLAVVWNYTSLREIYDSTERAWLDRKASFITDSSKEWMPILLEEMLGEMVQQQPGLGNQEQGLAAEIWKDKAAYQLWKNSALRDLGFPCLIEVIDSDGEEESLFATGFLRDLRYEISWRGPWTDLVGNNAEINDNLIFQLERRNYPGGQEEILAAEVQRKKDAGWIRVELPLRSWRISTLMSGLVDNGPTPDEGYRPRDEVDRSVLLLRGDDSGWLAASGLGLPTVSSAENIAKLKNGAVDLAQVTVDDVKWLCVWRYLPADATRSPGEGFLLGLQRAEATDDLLDLSRLMLLNFAIVGIILLPVLLIRRYTRSSSTQAGQLFWFPGFQEKFLIGFLLLGFILLLIVGMSVDRVGYERVRSEARTRTQAGLSQVVQQLRGLMIEQARSFAGSEYIADMLVGQLAGQRPTGPQEFQQGMVFDSDGQLLLDETLSNLNGEEASLLLAAARANPMVVIDDEGELFIATVIPIDLAEVMPEGYGTGDGIAGHGAQETAGFFFYRQQFDADLILSLAALVQGQVTLRFDGRPVMASHPAAVFSGMAPLLADPNTLLPLLDHPAGPWVGAAAGRPFAFTGHRVLPSFARNQQGRMIQRQIPAVLALAFPDRELEYAQQRRGTILFLAGLANLILFTALLLALLLSWNIFRPLRMLLGATRGLARGDFSVPLPEASQDEVGRLSGAFGSMRGQLQTTRNELATRERFLATVLDRVPVGVAVLEPDLKVVSLNPSGRHILTDFHPEVADEDGVRVLLTEFQQQAGGAERVVCELHSPDGSRTMRGAMAPLPLTDVSEDSKADIMLVFEDITEFLDNKKMALNAELTRQVAHEIKNPLTPIQLSIQLLQQAWQDDHPQLDKIVQDTTRRVLDQVDLLRTIAAEFSLLGRPDELELNTLNFRDQIERVIGSPVASAGHETGSSTGPRFNVSQDDIPPVVGHTDSLLKILGNLLRNSLDAVPEDLVPEITIKWRVDAETVTCLWLDNGSGLPAEVAGRLFEPYFSTKSKGTGLGLAICRNLVGRIGGTITLRNRTDGQGAVAELTLPSVLE